MTREERKKLETDRQVWRWMMLRKGWVSAKQLAKQHQVDWRQVCRSLKRLARQGKLEEDTRSWYDAETRLRECSIYRRAPRLHAAMPAWAVPRVLPHSAGRRGAITASPRD